MNLSVKTKEDVWPLEKGYEIAYAQFIIDVSVENCRHILQGDQVTVEKKDTYYEISGKDFHFTIDLDTGLMGKYYYKNDQVDTSYTGFAAYQGKKYYVLGGTVSKSKT